MTGSIHRISIPEFLHSNVEGVVDLEASKRNLQALCEVWRGQRDEHVLVDIRTADHQLTPVQIKELVAAVAASGLGTANRVAFLYVHRGAFDQVRFFEFLAVHGGLKIKAFEEYEHALDWLRDSPVSHPSAAIRQA